MLKLDIDDYKNKSRLKLLKLFCNMPYPYFVRFSSSMEGLHIKNPNLDSMDDLRLIYDDPFRIEFDGFRRQHGLPIFNLLWDVKEGKKAGKWKKIKNSKDAINFIDSISTE
jgi:hypothetical protein